MPVHCTSLCSLLFIACLTVRPVPVQSEEPPSTVRFNREIRPILSDKCFACHGPDSRQRKAGLRLDLRERAIEPLESGGTAIVPGDPEASELFLRVADQHAPDAMPPAEAKLERLTASEIETLRRWIAEGAAYEPHWAFLPVEMVHVPAAPERLPPGVAVHGPIDRLLFARLVERGLTAQPEADRATLIRRVSLDLTGLPPMPAEIDSFVNDPDPEAYSRLVDRLLKSPHYGERRAADWLDLARYADSFGFQVDREREMWPWRDWVIQAFNANLPWDQFVTWQLAGDLLPEPTDEQILATAFNRLHQQEAEGGSIEEEYRVNYVNDRVVTFGTAFLGLTLECCRCHDHKFDPLTQREYYQFFALFDDIDEAGLYSFFTQSAPTPTMWLLDPNQKQQLAAAQAAVTAAEARLADLPQERAQAFEDWLTRRPALALPAEVTGELARFPFDARDAAGKFPSQIDASQTATSPVENQLVPGLHGQALLLTGDHAVTTTLGNFHRYEPFSIALWMRTPDVKERAVILHRSRAWTDAASRGYELLIEEGRLKWSLIHFWPGNAASIRAVAPLPVDNWVHVALTSDGSSRAAGLGLSINGKPVPCEIIRDGLTRDITGGGGDTIALGERFRDRGFKGGLVDDLRVFGRELTALEIGETYAAGTLPGLLSKAGSELSEAELAALRRFYFENYDEPFRQQRQALLAARQRQSQLADAAREIMVMRELPQPRTAYLLKRGEYQNRAEVVEPGTPAALPAFPAGAPRNRLGLARWLTDPRHPLLARVTVNRLWQSCFGRGLVKTAEDLGSQSDRPEYPELLDWLAGELVRSGWDVKGLLKTIVLSHTYRQRSLATPQVMSDDPENIWLARGPRYRLPAEMIRDSVLAASGLLVDWQGGPPVRTYDLPESFKPVAAGTGEQLYRRSLYTFWRRTGPGPVLEAFDVPNRVTCVARRDRTNTALHTLVLLNGPQFVEAARVLAERLHREQGGQRDALLEQAFLRLTSRHPDAREREILARMYDRQQAWYRAHPEQAASYLQIGETKPDAALPAADIAAAAAVINGLMNYDGAVVKR